MAVTITGSTVTGYSAPVGVGAGQSWAAHSARSANTWYQNTTGKPIMIWNLATSGLYVYIGVSTSSYWAGYCSNSDSDLDSGVTFVVPVNHYWKVSALRGFSDRQGYLL